MTVQPDLNISIPNHSPSNAAQQYLHGLCTDYYNNTNILDQSIKSNLVDIDRLCRLCNDLINLYHTNSSLQQSMTITLNKQYELINCVIKSEIDKLHNQLIALYTTINNSMQQVIVFDTISPISPIIHDINQFYVYLHHSLNTLIQLAQYCDNILNNNGLYSNVMGCITEELITEQHINDMVTKYNHLCNRSLLTSPTDRLSISSCLQCNNTHLQIHNIQTIIDKYTTSSSNSSRSNTPVSPSGAHLIKGQLSGITLDINHNHGDDESVANSNTGDILLDDKSSCDSSSGRRASAMGLGKSCHQCKTKKPSSELLFCTNCARKTSSTRVCRKKYCKLCLCWYSVVLDNVTEEMKQKWKCPACLGFCTCANCQRVRKAGPKIKQSNKRKLSVSNNKSNTNSVIALPTPPTLIPTRAVSLSSATSSTKTRGYSVPVAQHDQLQYMSSLPIMQQMSAIDRTQLAQHMLQQSRSATIAAPNNHSTPRSQLLQNTVPSITFGQCDTQASRSITHPVLSQQQWQQMSLQQQYVHNYQQHANFNTYQAQAIFNNTQTIQQTQSYYPMLQQQQTYNTQLIKNEIVKPEYYNTLQQQQQAAQQSVYNDSITPQPNQVPTHDLSHILQQ